MPLPVDATAFARDRYALALTLAAHCVLPGGEAALSGSAARGVSDKWSDIEMHLWVDVLPSYDDLAARLSAVGAEVEPLEEDGIGDDMLQVKSWYRGVFVETICQTWSALDTILTSVIEARTSDHWTMTEVWHVVHAVPLSEASRLAEWQERLTHYPVALQERLVRSATMAWADPHWYPVSAVNLWPIVHRGNRIAVAGRLIREVEKALRLLWAINDVWEPDWKWLAPESTRLHLAPANLVQRVDAIMTLTDPVRSAQDCLMLILDVLDLAPSRYNLSLQKRLVREALDPEALLRPLEALDSEASLRPRGDDLA